MPAKKSTMVVFVLDQSGSMASVIDETISGFNDYIKTLRATEARVLFDLTVFNSNAITHPFRMNTVDKVPSLTKLNYHPNGYTPLYDAIGQAINDAEKNIAALKTKPSVLLAIMTDGLENASRFYSREAIFDRIQGKERDNWTAVYLGANQDAFAAAQSIGVDVTNAAAYTVEDTYGGMMMMAGASAGWVETSGMQNRNFFSPDDTTNVKRPKAVKTTVASDSGDQ